mgnify:CR=1 FL=1
MKPIQKLWPVLRDSLALSFLIAVIFVIGIVFT